MEVLGPTFFFKTWADRAHLTNLLLLDIRHRPSIPSIIVKQNIPSSIILMPPHAGNNGLPSYDGLLEELDQELLTHLTANGPGSIDAQPSITAAPVQPVLPAQGPIMRRSKSLKHSRTDQRRPSRDEQAAGTALPLAVTPAAVASAASDLTKACLEHVRDVTVFSGNILLLENPSATSESENVWRRVHLVLMDSSHLLSFASNHPREQCLAVLPFPAAVSLHRAADALPGVDDHVVLEVIGSDPAAPSWKLRCSSRAAGLAWQQALEHSIQRFAQSAPLPAPPTAPLPPTPSSQLPTSNLATWRASNLPASQPRISEVLPSIAAAASASSPGTRLARTTSIAHSRAMASRNAPSPTYSTQRNLIDTSPRRSVAIPAFAVAPPGPGLLQRSYTSPGPIPSASSSAALPLMPPAYTNPSYSGIPRGSFMAPVSPPPSPSHAAAAVLDRRPTMLVVPPRTASAGGATRGPSPVSPVSPESMSPLPVTGGVRVVIPARGEGAPLLVGGGTVVSPR
ncbi:hypothetical protein HDU96_006962 [Phlyctochytrium bullatum]|nr:hypothetical protein HDU96_006962 [Phlyctochytrium bullatum]